MRLGLYIGFRNRGHGQDKRYAALLKHQQGPLVPFLIRKIYGLQGVLILVVSLPVQFAMYEFRSLGVLGAIGIAVWTVGFVFESVGDYQLSRFKADPANAGKVMDRGLWAWTRHPNYFGDACVWVGLFILALGDPLALITIVSPIVMIKLLVSYSGKALLERGMRKSKGQAYDDYVARNQADSYLVHPVRHETTRRERPHEWSRRRLRSGIDRPGPVAGVERRRSSTSIVRRPTGSPVDSRSRAHGYRRQSDQFRPHPLPSPGIDGACNRVLGRSTSGWKTPVHQRRRRPPGRTTPSAVPRSLPPRSTRASLTVAQYLPHSRPLSA